MAIGSPGTTRSRSAVLCGDTRSIAARSTVVTAKAAFWRRTPPPPGPLKSEARRQFSWPESLAHQSNAVMVVSPFHVSAIYSALLGTTGLCNHVFGLGQCMVILGRDLLEGIVTLHAGRVTILGTDQTIPGLHLSVNVPQLDKINGPSLDGIYLPNCSVITRTI